MLAWQQFYSKHTAAAVAATTTMTTIAVIPLGMQSSVNSYDIKCISIPNNFDDNGRMFDKPTLSFSLSCPVLYWTNIVMFGTDLLGRSNVAWHVEDMNDIL